MRAGTSPPSLKRRRPYHHDQFVERMESMRGCTYRPEKGYLRFLMWETHKKSYSHSQSDVCKSLR